MDSQEQSRVAHEASRTVPHLVREQALLRPGAVAVASGALEVTYGELQARAQALAVRLRACGVGPDAVVGICIRSSPAMVVGALGALEAGGAYLPLDPDYPTARLEHILGDAAARVIVSVRGAGPCLCDPRWSVVELEEDGTVASEEAACAPSDGAHSGKAEAASSPAPADLAYVIYTSGSTGQPKGVEIEHRSLMNLVDWHQRQFSVSSADRATQIAGVGFDAAVWELWPYLTAGASIHLPEPSVRTDPEALRDWLVLERITVAFAPTAMAERLMQLDWPADTTLRALLTGADTLHRFPGLSLPFRVVNNYGPTECTVVATSGTVPPEAGGESRPTIGRPIGGASVYVLDRKRQRVPQGISGEIYVGGAGVARGYRNRPDLTAEKFLPDPFSTTPGARMYRTGDLGYVHPDGEVVFLGRADDQIKLRGYRIEPAEITAALHRHHAISQSAVVARDAGNDEKRLVAYVVPVAGETLTLESVRGLLRQSLPEYMLPSAFVRLDELPMTAHGKLDRAALPQPDAANTLGESPSDSPRSPVEERVALLLAQLLEVPSVGVKDNFFELGGHSLLGAQVIARVRDTFGIDLSLRVLFDSPTVEGLSCEVERLIFASIDELGSPAARELATSSV